MKLIRLGTLALLVLTLTGGLAAPAFAQPRVSDNDVQRLQDTIRDTSHDVEMARSRDARLATQLQAELDDARDEAAYLKVKLRKGEAISYNDYADLRDRVERIRDDARGETRAAARIRSRLRSSRANRRSSAGLRS